MKKTTPPLPLGQRIAPQTGQPEFNPAIVDTAKSNLIPQQYARAQRSATVVEVEVPSMGTRGNQRFGAVEVEADGTIATPPAQVPAE
jgi:hypothetical protein